MAVFICGLIVYAICTLTNAFASPAFSVLFIVSSETAHNIAFGALAVAIALTIITLTIVIKDKRKGVSAKTQEPNAIGAIKELNETTAKIPSQVNIQKNANAVETDIAKQKNQSVKQSLMEPAKLKPTKLICPACRKEFSLPIYMRDYMVDFVTPKQSNLTRFCPYCQTPIALKQKGEVQADAWNHNV